MPQAAHLRCRLQEPYGRSGSAFVQRRLTKRSREHPFRNCPKSLGRVYSVALRTAEKALFGPFWSPYTVQIHGRALLKALFGQSLELDFSHLRVKGVGYARHQSAQREVIEVRTPYR